MIHIYTGEGKGKTTASVGLAIRAKSRGLKVLFVQVMKSFKGGELELLNKAYVDVRLYEEIKSPIFYPNLHKDKSIKQAKIMIEEIINEAEKYDMIIIDEFNCLVMSEILTEEDAIKFIKKFPPHKELILTGRGATDKMIQQASYVTYMKEIKHPYKNGIKARKGIEF